MILLLISRKLLKRINNTFSKYPAKLLGKLFKKRYMYITNNHSKIIRTIAVSIAGAALMSSCTTVKEYQKNRLNDGEMVLGNRKVEKTELSFQSYREGASGANAGKSGGGCGCN